MATIDSTPDEVVAFIEKHGIDTFFRAMEPFSVRVLNATIDGIHVDVLREMVLRSNLPLPEISDYLDKINELEKKRAEC